MHMMMMKGGGEVRGEHVRIHEWMNMRIVIVGTEYEGFVCLRFGFVG